MNLKQKRYGTVLCDPPWTYKKQELWGRPEAADHYPTLTTDEICRLPVGSIAGEPSHLYLWTTNKHLLSGDAVRVVKSWGFRPKTLITWCKPQLGLGSPFRTNTEQVLFAVRGPLPFQRSSTGTWFEEKRTRHSRKPEKLFKIIDLTSPGPRLELFARSIRKGWDVWGQEVGDPFGWGFDPSGWSPDEISDAA